MEGEPNPGIVQAVASELIQVEPDKKSRQRGRKAPESVEAQVTAAGKAKAQEVRDTLIEMVDKLAVTESKRRRGTMIDESDYETAFTFIAGPPKRENAISIVADVAAAIGTGLIGFAINIYTGSLPSNPVGHLAMIGGIALLALGIVIKYVIPRI